MKAFKSNPLIKSFGKNEEERRLHFVVNDPRLVRSIFAYVHRRPPQLHFNVARLFVMRHRCRGAEKWSKEISYFYLGVIWHIRHNRNLIFKKRVIQNVVQN